MWYIDREGNRCAAVVSAIDLMHPPPSYCIRLNGADSLRETEGHRLELRTLTHAPAGQPGAATAAIFLSTELWANLLLCTEKENGESNSVRML